MKGSLGLDLDEADLKAAAARIARTIRQFNEQEGAGPADDAVPEYFFIHPVGSGGFRLEHDQFSELVGDYYRVRGFGQEVSR